MLTLQGYDLGWVVGFLEGEGSFICATIKPRGRFPRGNYVFCVVASQVQRQPLEKLQELVGMGRISKALKHNENPRAALFFRWSLTGERGREFAKYLLPYMSPRRQWQITTALDKWDKRPLLTYQERRLAWRDSVKKATIARWGLKDPRQGQLG